MVLETACRADGSRGGAHQIFPPITGAPPKCSVANDTAPAIYANGGNMTVMGNTGGNSVTLDY
jgi:hypothetical protein